MIKHHIDKTDGNPLCRLCEEQEETVAHIVSECKQLAQKQYKEWRHDAIVKIIHLEHWRHLGPTRGNGGKRFWQINVL